MFESTKTFTDTFDQIGASSEAAELRAVVWPELVARLAAARDVRSVLDRAGNNAAIGAKGRNGGSFVSAAGVVLGGQAEPDRGSERAINLVGLSGGKPEEALCADAANVAVHVDREAL